MYNNSTTPGLADRAANELRQRGWNVPMVGNYNAVDVPESAVYFRPSTQEEDAARALAVQFGLRALPRFEGILNASPGVIIMTRGELGANEN
ncbi:LytR C-terminal domain-containing protein [Actinomycetospora lutea]|uniref:LytR C-terminal domain-containing protein n=1 Tax=Actinomycetospora lutea TaxID=663604 RepID=UPI002365CCEA|nr:LytR C-terminal domain-containing protein [Actinomycetospora lutea]MDD7942822.1 LytR C-terminal domain-containing protein [Actinomycetospora lutea]